MLYIICYNYILSHTLSWGLICARTVNFFFQKKSRQALALIPEIRIKFNTTSSNFGPC